jgi:hypothetical protein
VTVQDVFKHVLDLFELVAKSESDPDNAVIWRLAGVSMNSPLTVTAEAVSAKPGADIVMIACAQKAEFASNLNSLRRGVIPRIWCGELTIKVAKDFLNRNANWIGITKIAFEGAEFLSPIEITHADADFAVKVLEAADAGLLAKPAKTQIGSIDGNIVDVRTYYKKPAIVVRERKTGAEIWCVINDDFRREIADTTTFEDVWKNQRVSVSGIIEYDKERRISRILVSHIKRIEAKTMPTSSIMNPDFTEGLSAADYLEKLREGALG